VLVWAGENTHRSLGDHMKMRLLAGALATIVGGLLGLAPGGAAVLSPGDTGVTPDALTLNGPHTGLVASIIGGLHAPFFTGSYSEKVFTDPTNVWGKDDLTWIINVENSKGSFDSITQIVAESFAGFNVDVGNDTDFPHGHIPVTVDRLTAATIGFNFVPGNGIAEGEESTFLEIETNAKQFTSGNLDINPGITGVQVSAFAPFAPPAVPEPSTWGLASLGFAGLGLLRIAKRRFRVAECAFLRSHGETRLHG
jgi:PEP-CTERM motif